MKPSTSTATAPVPAIYHTFRLKPGDDLGRGIQAYAEAHHLRAASVVTVVGSLTQAAIRYANKPNATLIKKDLEIVSFTGTVSINGSHLHLSVAGPDGVTLGGHLMDGSIVRTTAEITLVEFPELDFVREPDPQSGYNELVVKPRS